MLTFSKWHSDWKRLKEKLIMKHVLRLIVPTISGSKFNLEVGTASLSIWHESKRLKVLTLSSRMPSDRQPRVLQQTLSCCLQNKPCKIEHIVKSVSNKILTVKLVAECLQLGVGTTDAHFFKTVLWLDRVKGKSDFETCTETYSTDHLRQQI